MNHDLQVGVVGLGFMGATHVEALLAGDQARLAAVCSRDPTLLSGDLRGVGGNLGLSFSKHDFSALGRLEDWRELVHLSELDCVHVCLPTELHEGVCIAALRAGKHVLCEKPMGSTTESCDRMLQEASSAGRVLMIGHVLRFAPAYEYLLDTLARGSFGTLRSAIFTRQCGLPSWSKWLTDEVRSGGAILDLLIHDIDIALLCCGVPSAVAARSLGEVDTLAASLIYPSGPEVRIQGGWFSPDTPFAMGYRAQFEDAVIEFSAGKVRLETAGTSTPIAVDSAVPYAREIDYFLGCCRSGTPPLRCPPEQARDAVRVALALRESRGRGGESISCLV